MKHLLLTMALTVFSLNSFASTKCLISFEGIGNDKVGTRELKKTFDKKNFKAVSLYDIGDGDFLASITEFGHDEELSTNESQVITFTQVIQKLYPYAGDFRMDVVHTKTVSIDIPNDEFAKLRTHNIPAFIAKYRVEALPRCTMD